MPTVSDSEGSRDVSEAEVDAIRAAGDASLQQLFAGLEWLPATDYRQAHHRDVIARSGEDWAFAFSGPWDNEFFPPEPNDTGARWRHADHIQHSIPLDFEPTDFAVVDDDWAMRFREG